VACPVTIAVTMVVAVPVVGGARCSELR